MSRHDQDKIRNRIIGGEQSQAQERAMEQGRRGARHQVCDALSPKSGDKTSPPVMCMLSVISRIFYLRHVMAFLRLCRVAIKWILSCCKK
ncbi:hypothetical protein [Streptosporangium sp. V21-05]|uniref:hypothetical protein n=1 Tax=Streptosporangium sp. V21-05 TaxID=3446115 RepID=UPI003F53D3DE